MKALAKGTRNNSGIAKQFELVIALNAQDKVCTYTRYSASLMLVNLITSDTGGWDPKTGVFFKEINEQIDQAFANVDLNLKDAGGKGWEQVFRVNSYHVPINNEALDAMVRNFKRWMPNHQPIWTCVGVTRLGEDDMRVEIEVVAHDP